tara:strand:- start:103 stop:1086 length:984 start_codon:yes stop_codon:yes gene_type:complete
MPIQQMLLGAGGEVDLPVEDIFKVTSFTGNTSNSTTIAAPGNKVGAGVAVWHGKRTASNDKYYYDSDMSAGELLIQNDTASKYTGWSNSFEGFGTTSHDLGTNDGWADDEGYVNFQFKRYKNFFDFGTVTKNSSSQSFSHNLKTTPRFMMVKRMDSSSHWYTYNYFDGKSKYIKTQTLNEHGDARTTDTNVWNNTSPTSTQFTLGSTITNGTYKYMMWGNGDFCNVEYYSGNNSVKNIVTANASGYTFQPQFIAIRRLNGFGWWSWFDTTRGIPDGDVSRWAAHNSTGGSSDDWIDLTSTGFDINQNGTYLNQSGGEFIYIAIAKVT